MDENTEISDEKQIDKPWLFKPGQSGNPKGKPKGTISITQMVKRELRRRDPETRKTWLEIFVRRALLKAIKDQDTQMIKLIWNYVDGMPVQPITGNGGGPITIDVLSERIKNDPEATAIATRLLEQITAGEGDAGGSGVSG